MSIEVFKRKENKFFITKSQYEFILGELENHMICDEHNKNNNLYTISNIYYDTKDSYLIRNSLSKPTYKEKLRLRAYGVPQKDTKVFLEIKKKFEGIVNKRRTTLTLEEATEFVRTRKKPELKRYMNKQVINEIEYMLNNYDLHEKVYLAYDRYAMFGKENKNFRVTFDCNIRVRRKGLSLDLGDYGETILDEKNFLMEVKADNKIPLWFVRMLSENKIYKTSFSKYGFAYKEELKHTSKILYKGVDMPCLNQSFNQQQIQQQYPL